MAFSNGPTVVTSGLVLSLDAADRNSYPGSGTMWRDLSGNGNNSTLVNGPTFNSANQGSIVFDGVDDYTSINIPATVGTIDFWFYYTQNTTNKLIMGNSQNSMIYAGGAGGIYHWYRGSEDYSFAGVFGNSTKWVNMTAVYTSDSNNTMYVNGNLSYSSTTYTIIKQSPYYVAGNVYNPQNTRFASIRVYNRALSASEVAQNYNATKTRFGL